MEDRNSDTRAPSGPWPAGQVSQHWPSDVARGWIAWYATTPGPAAPVSFRRPAADVYLDGEIEGQRYQAYVVGTSLRIRSRRAFNSTARPSVRSDVPP